MTGRRPYLGRGHLPGAEQALIERHEAELAGSRARAVVAVALAARAAMMTAKGCVSARLFRAGSNRPCMSPHLWPLTISLTDRERRCCLESSCRPIPTAPLVTRSTSLPSLMRLQT